MKYFFLSGILLITSLVFGQDGDKQLIEQVLSDQQECWNEGDLECFMEGYWNSEDLMFIGKSGITYGWKQTLANYKKSYPSRDAMGQLSFQILEMEKLSEDFWMVVGKWSLQRKGDNPKGHFSLIFRNFGGEWLIVSDHSS